MNFVFDGIFVAVIIAFALIGRRKGLFRSLALLIAAVIAFSFSGMISGFLSEPIYSWLFKGPVTTAVADAAGSIVSGASTTVMDALPEFLKGIINMAGDSSDINSIASNSAAAIQTAIMYVVEPLIIKLIGIVLLVIVFILLLVLIRLLIRPLNRLLMKIPIVKGVNRFFGFIFGMIKGLIIMWVVCMIVNAVCAPISNSWFANTYNQTYICKSVGSFNPFSYIFK